MLYTRWRKVWLDLWSNKTRTVLIVLTIMLGTFSVGWVNYTHIMIQHDMNSDHNSVHPSEATIYAYPLDENWVQAIRKMPGVQEAEGRRLLSAQWHRPDGQVIDIQMSAIKSIDEQRLDRLKPADPVDGRLPELGTREVVFDRSARSLGLQAGDLIEIELPNGAKRTLRFTGYVHDVRMPTYAMQLAVSAYITPKTAEWLGAEPGLYNELLVRVAENRTDYNAVMQVVNSIADRLEKNNLSYNGVFIYNPGYHFAWDITQGVLFILNILSGLIIALSFFLIFNTIVALMAQHTRQIGIMKAIGAGGGQIFPLYLALMLSFGVLAFAIAVPLAWRLSGLTLRFIADFLNFDVSPAPLPIKALLLQAAVALLTPLAAALLPMLNGLRIPVREALGSYGLGGSSQKAGSLVESRLGFISRPVLVSMRNAFRRKARVTLTLLTLILGGAIFIGVFNLWASFDAVMYEIQGYFLADVNVNLNGAYKFETLRRLSAQVPGVSGAEGWLVYNGTLLSADKINGDEVAFVAPPSDSQLIQASIVEGRWLRPEDTNVMVIGNHLLKIRPDLQVGDWVTVKLNGKKTAWQIIGRYQLPGNINPPLLYTNYEYLSRQVGMVGRIYQLRVITASHDAAAQDLVAAELQRLFKQEKIGISLIQTAGEWVQSQKSQTDVLVYVILAMASLVAVVGGLGLTSTMSLNVMERTREIGVMRALGASDGGIQKIVIVEGLVIGGLAWVFGVAFSVPITYLLNYGVGVSIVQAPLPVTFAWTGSLAWLVCMLGIATVASAVPAWRASRLTVRDTLAYE